VGRSEVKPSWSESLALLGYSFLLWIATPVLLLKIWWRGRLEPLYRSAWPERLGYLGRLGVRSGAVWIHAVSLGETRAAGILMHEIRQRRPDLCFVLTHGTATGREAGARLLGPSDVQAWQPWDSIASVERFLDRTRPVALILMETEVWPNLIDRTRRRGIPVLLANARMSSRSLARAARWPRLARPAYRSLTCVMAQTEADAQHLQQLGASVLLVSGNLKFDQAIDPAAIDRGHAWRRVAGARRIVILASSREGEEEALLEQLSKGPQSDVLWLIVPRHPNRFDDVARLSQSYGMTVSRRSEWPGSYPDERAAHADVWLGDSVGEMQSYYGSAELALLGGSFEPYGGQNLIEAAACGCPVIMGPHTYNFHDSATRAVEFAAAVQVSGLVDALLEVTRVFREEAVLQKMRVACELLSVQGRGSAPRQAEALLGLLDVN
jgi:3-deoxy-D-manno-octulosonic-acid transferase